MKNRNWGSIQILINTEWPEEQRFQEIIERKQLDGDYT